MPDVDHAPDFWTSVATAFKGNDAVIFDLFNEPFPDGNRNTATAWTTWRDGGTEYLRNTTTPYQAAGMQRLVDAVRTTGATNVIGLGGVQFANTLTGWLAHKPVDPRNNIVALWHVYNDTWQNTVAEYDATVLPVAAQVPVVATEVGTTGCDAAWFETLLRWLEANGLGYVGWGWNTWGNDCAQYSLIADYAGTPTQKGATFKDHLAGLR